MDDIDNDTKLKEKAFRVAGRLEDPYFNCPKCKKSIPLVQLIKTEDTALMRTNCPKCREEGFYHIDNYISSITNKTPTKLFCQFKYTHKHNLAIKYCLQCTKWGCNSCIKEHLAFSHSPLGTDINLSIFCAEEAHAISKEKKSMKFFCENCNKSICTKCRKEQHTMHKTFEHKDLDITAQTFIKNFSFEKTDEMRRKNKENKDQLLFDLNDEISKLIQLKNELIIAFEENDKVNSDIQQYINLLKKNYQMFNSINKIETKKSYEIITNIINNMKINDKEMKLNKEKRLRECTNEFIQFLKDNYIVEMIKSKDKISNKYECSNIIETKSEITCCIPIKIQKENRILYGCSNGDIILPSNINSNNNNSDDRIFKNHTNEIITMIILQDGRLVSSSLDKTILFWKLDKNTSEQFIQNEEAKCMIQLKDTRLITGLVDTTVKIWDVKTLNCISIIKGHNGIITSIIELNDGRLVTASKDKLIKMWNVRVVNPIDLTTLIGHKEGVTKVLFLKNGRMASASEDKMIFVWDVNNLIIQMKIVCGASIADIKEDFPNVFMQLRDDYLAVAFNDKIVIWNMANNKEIEILNERSKGNNKNIIGLIETAEGNIISCSMDKIIRVWKKKSTCLLN